MDLSESILEPIKDPADVGLTANISATTHSDDDDDANEGERLVVL